MAHNLSDGLASLAKTLDKKVVANKKKKLSTVIVLLSYDKKEGKKSLNAFEQKHGLKNTAFAVYEGTAGPKNYKIAKEAEVTVMMWAKRKIAVNHAFGKDKLDSKAEATVVESISKILK